MARSVPRVALHYGMHFRRSDNSQILTHLNSVTEAWRKSNAKQAHRAGSARKQDPLVHRAGTAQYARKQDRFADDRDLTSDSDGDITGDSQGSPSPKLEDEIAYSYDSNGPSNGSKILDMALSKAVEKFEDKQTSKLVKDE